MLKTDVIVSVTRVVIMLEDSVTTSCVCFIQTFQNDNKARMFVVNKGMTLPSLIVVMGNN